MARKTERQLDIERLADRAKIEAAFGNTDYNYSTKIDDLGTQGRTIADMIGSIPDTYEQLQEELKKRGIATTMDPYAEPTPGPFIPAFGKGNLSLAVYKSIAPGVTYYDNAQENDKRFRGDGGLYDKIREAINNNYSTRLNESLRDIQRELAFALARRGQSGGSIGVDKFGELKRKMALDVSDYTNNTETAVTQFDKSLNSYKDDLINSLNEDTTAEAQLASLDRGISRRRDLAVQDALKEDVGANINRFAAAQNLGAYVKGVNEATNQFRPASLVRGGNRNYYGRVTQ